MSRSAKHGIVCLDNIVRTTYVYIAELLIGVKFAYSHNENVDIQFDAHNAFLFWKNIHRVCKMSEDRKAK